MNIKYSALPLAFLDDISKYEIRTRNFLYQFRRFVIAVSSVHQIEPPPNNGISVHPSPQPLRAESACPAISIIPASTNGEPFP